jgi:hypothetical protein
MTMKPIFRQSSFYYVQWQDTRYRADSQAAIEAPLGHPPRDHIHIHTPLIHLDKAGIIRLGIELKAPLELPGRATGPSPEPPAIAHRAAFASKASPP